MTVKELKDCRNCKYGKYNDHYGIRLCHNVNNCVDWNLWELKEKERIMTDLINRQAAIATVRAMREKCDTGSIDDYHDMMVEAFEVLPSGQPKGKWIPYLQEGLTMECSECGSRYDRPWLFCPNCGADMREGE